MLADSDNNNITDDLEDYDLDNYTNAEEYSLSQDPCTSDLVDEIPGSESTSILPAVE